MSMDEANLHDEIVSLARELYERSGRVEGRDLDNWLEAEKIVRARYATEGENRGEAIESNNMKYIEDEKKGHRRLIVNGIQRSALDSSYSKIINISITGVDKETTKMLEKESGIKKLLLLRENEKICFISIDLLETELKMIEEELQKASERMNQKEVRLSEVEKELIILNAQKYKFDYRKKIAASFSLFSFLIFIGMFTWYLKPIAFLFGFLFLGLCVYSAFNFLKSHKLKSFISRKNKENAELIIDLGKLWKSESFCKNKYNHKVDMIEKQRKELETIAAKISEFKNNIIALGEKEKIHYEVLEHEYDNMSIKEKRKYERRSFVKHLKYSLQDVHTGKLALTPSNGVSVDISEGGVGVITDYALKKGDILFFEEEIKEEEIKINKIAPIAAIVRWAKQIEQNKYRAGLVFRTV
jgi:hypothetical protein